EGGRAERRERQAAQRRQRRVRGDPGPSRVLEVVAAREDALAGRARDELDESLGGRAAVARREHGGSGDVLDRAGIMTREVVQLRVDPAVAELELEAVPVVLVDQAGCDVAA